jgi:hypothetical protein
MIVFEQHFSKGATGTSIGTPNDVIASFPTLQINSEAPLRYLTFQGLWDTGSIGNGLYDGASLLMIL